jgi:hypothetical protein
VTDTDATYPVKEATGNPAHPSFEKVWAHMHERGHNPCSDTQDTHLDELLAELFDRYGEETVRTVAHRILVEIHPFRTATVDLGVQNIDGVRIGIIAVGTLRELHDSADASASF